MSPCAALLSSAVAAWHNRDDTFRNSASVASCASTRLNTLLNGVLSMGVRISFRESGGMPLLALVLGVVESIAAVSGWIVVLVMARRPARGPLPRPYAAPA